MRVNHGLNLHVTTITSAPAGGGGGGGTIELEQIIVTCNSEGCGESKGLLDQIRELIGDLKRERERQLRPDTLPVEG